MRQLRIFSACIVVVTGLAGSGCNGAEASASAPDFKEVYDLIREHLGGATDTELNRAAVAGLVSELSPRVALVGSSQETNSAAGSSTGSATNKSSVFSGDIVYVRVGRVDGGLARDVRVACEKSGTTNQLEGLVLDLRYAKGTDYGAAAAVVELFTRKAMPLLDWGNGMIHSTAKEDAIDLPVATLVNRQTAGAAEALAGVIREAKVGLILGSRTAGQAMIAQEYPLKNGERLRIGTAPIHLGDGAALSEKGVAPDVEVVVSAQDELAYFGDAYKILAPVTPIAESLSSTNVAGNTNTNRAARRGRLNEAELVRERRDGGLPLDQLAGEGDPGKPNEPEKPVIQDPALARAIDVLKGLAVVRHSRS
ncbi:MAG: hypothetical protein C5B50_28800 [Verrucomicrobia bacterium]|nr:MAG: hypothetical protein C5B50_28800 [Verrucomicrobiota bacterium]